MLYISSGDCLKLVRKALYIIILCLLSLYALSVEVSADQRYKVKKGDTLYKIAGNYGVSVKEIKIANGLKGSGIHPGDLIVVPTKTSVKTKNNKDKINKADIVKKTDKKSNNLITHKVKKGDTLYRISKKYGISVREVKKINNLSGSFVKVGQRLKVPGGQVDDEVPFIVDDSAADVEIAAVNEVSNDVEAAVASQEEGVEPLTENFAEDRTEIASNEPTWFSRIVDTATEYMGVPYRFGGTTLAGIDCSAYVQMIYRYFSIELPRTAREQFKAGVKVSKKELMIGDLIFFRTYAKFPSHVGIYIGGGKMIHASSREKKVTVTNINEPYYVKRYIGAVRLPETPSVISTEELDSISPN